MKSVKTRHEILADEFLEVCPHYGDPCRKWQCVNCRIEIIKNAQIEAVEKYRRMVLDECEVAGTSKQLQKLTENIQSLPCLPIVVKCQPVKNLTGPISVKDS